MLKSACLKVAFALSVVLAAAGCGGADAINATEGGDVKIPSVAKSGQVGNAPTAVEQYLIGQGVTIAAAFESESGLKAIVAERGMERRLFYVTPDGNYMIQGTVYDAKGGTVTANDMARGSIRGDGVRQVLGDEELAKLWDQAGGLDYIAEGTSEKVVYVIFDPQCPYCHKLWDKLRPVVAQNGTQVRWVPVAILSEGSKNLAAGIYQAKDSTDALTKFGERTLTGVKVSKKTSGKLEQNLNLLRASGYTGVPAIIYQEGGKTRAMMSLPSDEELARIFM